jgi:FAD/FMN-containing dehydrogenase
VIETAMDAGEVVDAVVAGSTTQARQMWAIREATAEFSTRLVPISFDVSLPTGRIGDFVLEAKKAIAQQWPACNIVNFGHIGDNNLHLTVDEKPLEPDNGDRHLAIERVVYELVGRWYGSISAEHGIGLAKRDFLHHSVTPEALRMMGTLKRCMDPLNILNPGKVLPPSAASDQTCCKSQA